MLQLLQFVIHISLFAKCFANSAKYFSKSVQILCAILLLAKCYKYKIEKLSTTGIKLLASFEVYYDIIKPQDHLHPCASRFMWYFELSEISWWAINSFIKITVQSSVWGVKISSIPCNTGIIIKTQRRASLCFSIAKASIRINDSEQLLLNWHLYCNDIF